MAEASVAELQAEDPSPGPTLASTMGGHRPGHRSVTAGLGAAVTASALAATLVWHPRPLLIWNASASSPIGLYRLTSGPVGTGDMVAVWPPRRVRQLAANRHYLPLNVPLVKPVAAEAGDRVCARATTIFVNGRPAAVRRLRDPRGRPMPWWAGCRRLVNGQLLLLSRSGPRAFDGRYFGITRSGDIVGRATLLWPR